MYPPGVLLRVAQRYPVLRDIRPGKRRFLKRLTVFWTFYVPVMLAITLFNYFSGYATEESLLSMSISVFVGITFFCGQLTLLVRDDRPVLAAWLSVLTLAGFVIMTILGCKLAYWWFGAFGSVLVVLFVAGCFVYDRYKHGNPVEESE